MVLTVIFKILHGHFASYTNEDFINSPHWMDEILVILVIKMVIQYFENFSWIRGTWFLNWEDNLKSELKNPTLFSNQTVLFVQIALIKTESVWVPATRL